MRSLLLNHFVIMKRSRPQVECGQCKKLVRSDNLNRHLLTHKDKFECPFCKKLIREDRLHNHQVLCRDNLDESVCNRVSGVSVPPNCSSVNGSFESYDLPSSSSDDYNSIFEDTAAAARPIVEDTVQRHPVKCQLVVHLSFYKESDGERTESEKVFRSQCEPLVAGDDLDGFFRRALIILRHGVEVYERHGSG